MAGFDPGPIRRLVERICADPDLRLVTVDGLIVRPVQPPAFESLPHPDKVCQAAVKVVRDGDAPFYVSLCDVAVADVAVADVSAACEAAELAVA
jgi:hypothetical protein